jgi:hypothetical protein
MAVWPLRIVKFASTQPAPIEPIPKHNRVHFPGELINASKPVFADLLAGRVERNAVELAERVDLIPVRADAAGRATQTRLINLRSIHSTKLPSATSRINRKSEYVVWFSRPLRRSCRGSEQREIISRSAHVRLPFR